MNENYENNWKYEGKLWIWIYNGRLKNCCWIDEEIMRIFALQANQIRFFRRTELTLCHAVLCLKRTYKYKTSEILWFSLFFRFSIFHFSHYWQLMCKNQLLNDQSQLLHFFSCFRWREQHRTIDGRTRNFITIGRVLPEILRNNYRKVSFRTFVTTIP